MQERKESGSNILQKMALDAQSTHNIAAQATAGRLLRLLEERYSLLIGVGEPSKESQDKLLGYIEQKQARLIDETLVPVLADEDVSSHPLIQLINVMLELDFDESGDKQLLLTTLAAFVKNHPADVWSLSDEQWSRNKRYDAAQRKIELVSVSPAKTLLLVCAAILDGAHHNNPAIDERNIPMSSSSVQLNSDRQEQKRVRHLAKTLARCLLNLGKGAERRKCSGGRQHDLLWLLSGSYLDKNQHLFEFVDNLSVFLTMLINRFVEEQLLPKTTDAERRQLITDWIIYSTTTSDMKFPLFALLTRYYGEAWSTNYNEWMQQGCIAVELDPADTTDMISNLIERLDEWSIPIADTPHLHLIQELCNASLVTRCTPAIRGLVQARNAALTRFKSQVYSGQWSVFAEKHTAIMDFHTAESCFQTLMRYAGILLIGAEDLDIQNAGQPLIMALTDYFGQDTFSCLPESFTTIKNTWYELEKQFRLQSHIDVIANFFQAMKGDYGNFSLHWKRIKVIPGLELSDERIQQILNQHCVEAQIIIEENIPNQTPQISLEVTTELSTYDINRLLIHGLRIAPGLWSDIYHQTIALVCQWLLSPKSANDSLALVAVKQGYPQRLLPNLLLQTLLNNDEFKSLLSRKPETIRLLFSNTLQSYIEIGPMVQRVSIIQTIYPYFSLLIQDRWQLFGVLELHLGCNDFWVSIKSRLPALIQCIEDIKMLVTLDHYRFTIEQRNIFWEAIKTSLPVIIQNGYQLCNLLVINLKRFPAEQRNILWEAIRTRLPAIITNGDVLETLLKLDHKRFTTEQRNVLWDAIKTNLLVIIQSREQLRKLLVLNHTQFNSNQRRELFDALKEISRFKQLYIKYSPETLTDTPIATPRFFKSASQPSFSTYHKPQPDNFNAGT